MTTRIDEIADGIYRVHTPVPGFSFNQILVMDDEPLLFHAGPRFAFADVRAAVERVTPVTSLRHLVFSHVESDESGATNLFLAAAPRLAAASGQVAAMVDSDAFDRPLRGLADGEEIVLGRRRVRWLDTPHLPHGWSCGYLHEATTRTLLCGDLFTQGGDDHPPLLHGTDLVGPTESFRKQLDYFAHAPGTRARILRLAGLAPATLACMHGSAWQGDGGALLTALADAVAPA